MNSTNGCSVELLYQFKGKTLNERCKLRDDLLDRNIIEENKYPNNRKYYPPYKLNSFAFSSSDLYKSICWSFFVITIIILIVLLIVYSQAGDEGKSNLKTPLIIDGVIVGISVLLILRGGYITRKLNKAEKEIPTYFTDASIINQNINDEINSHIRLNKDNKPMTNADVDFIYKTYFNTCIENGGDYDKAEKAAIKAFEDSRKNQ
jgi:hypothetical protein